MVNSSATRFAARKEWAGMGKGMRQPLAGNTGI